MAISAPQILKLLGKGAFAGSMKLTPKLTTAIAKGSTAIATKLVPNAVSKVASTLGARLATQVGVKVLYVCCQGRKRRRGSWGLASLAFDLQDQDHLILPGDTSMAQTAGATRQAVKDAVADQKMAWPIIIGPLTPLMNDKRRVCGARVGPAFRRYRDGHEPRRDASASSTISSSMRSARARRVADLNDPKFWTDAMTRLDMNVYMDATLANLCVAKGGKPITLSDGSFACSYTSSDGVQVVVRKHAAGRHCGWEGVRRVLRQQRRTRARLPVRDRWDTQSVYDIRARAAV